MNAQSRMALRTGNEMPVIGLGTWQLKNDTAGSVENALKLGYRMIDTSGDYGTQPGVGEGCKRSGLDRDEVYIVTKVEETDDAYEATHKNLEELGLEYVDLMLIHRPPKEGFGEDLWRGLMRARDEGLAKDIGVSNYSTEKIQQLIDATGEVPTVNQIEWSPFGHSEAMLAYCQDLDIIIQAYSPLTRQTRLDDARLGEIAATYDKTSAQVLLRWCLQLGIVPLPKANQAAHQEENLGIFDFALSDDDMVSLNGLNERYSSLGELPYV